MTPYEQQISDYVDQLLCLKTSDHFGGSLRLAAVCKFCGERGLSDDDAWDVISCYNDERPMECGIDRDKVIKCVQAARAKVLQRAMAGQPRPAETEEPLKPAYRNIAQLSLEFPELRPPLIHGLLRIGETMNVIAPPKTGKSWLVTDLALSVATGRDFLGTFRTEPGRVLIIDNELHCETSAHRIPKVAAARCISMDEIGESVYVENLRGRLRDLLALGSYFKEIGPGQFKLIILDAFYRFLPRDTDENDNGSVAQLYNYLDSYAADLGCSFVLIHHSTKGNQSGKAVTDVGAGAGSQSRATDTHLILRPHEEPGAVVLDASVRSWKPIEPVCLRWTYPVWDAADDLDPAALKPERARRQPKDAAEPAAPPEPVWDAARFVQQFVTFEAKIAAAIIEAAQRAGLSERKAEKLLRRAEDMHLAYRWQFASNEPVKYATRPQPLLDVPIAATKKSKRKKK